MESHSAGSADTQNPEPRTQNLEPRKMSQRQKPSLSWILILFVLIWLNGSSFTQSPQGQIPAGDADGDGFLSLFDLDALLDAVLAKEEAPGDADFNSDGEVNVADLAVVSQFENLGVSESKTYVFGCFPGTIM